jgi:hypothetical protein
VVVEDDTAGLIDGFEDADTDTDAELDADVDLCVEDILAVDNDAALWTMEDFEGWTMDDDDLTAWWTDDNVEDADTDAVVTGASV